MSNGPCTPTWGLPEYWRYDHTGGQQYDAALAGDRLTSEGVYRPIELTTEADGVIWGYSEALSLSVCWVERELRFWDRQRRRYLPNPSEMAAELDNERDARLAERDARLEAESRVRSLEAGTPPTTGRIAGARRFSAVDAPLPRP